MRRKYYVAYSTAPRAGGTGGVTGSRANLGCPISRHALRGVRLRACTPPRALRGSALRSPRRGCSEVVKRQVGARTPARALSTTPFHYAQVEPPAARCATRAHFSLRGGDALFLRACVHGGARRPGHTLRLRGYAARHQRADLAHAPGSICAVNLAAVQ